jgi:hypothetical protein
MTPETEQRIRDILASITVGVSNLRQQRRSASPKLYLGREELRVLEEFCERTGIILIDPPSTERFFCGLAVHEVSEEHHFNVTL